MIKGYIFLARCIFLFSSSAHANIYHSYTLKKKSKYGFIILLKDNLARTVFIVVLGVVSHEGHKTPERQSLSWRSQHIWTAVS